MKKMSRTDLPDYVVSHSFHGASTANGYQRQDAVEKSPECMQFKVIPRTKIRS